MPAVWKTGPKKSRSNANVSGNQRSGIRKSKKTGNTNGSTTQNSMSQKQLKLDDIIIEKRNQLVHKKNILPILKQNLALLKQSQDDSNPQFNSYIAKIEKRIEEIENDKELNEYEQKIIPYLQLKQWIQKSNGRAPNGQTIPNVSQVAQYHEHPDMKIDNLKPQNIIDEYYVEMGDAAPEINIMNMDTCKNCNVQKVIHPNHSRSLCPGCKQSFPYIEATPANIAYGDEVEHSSFNYDKGNHLREWINKIQAKESTIVSEEHLELVMQQLAENGFVDEKKIQKSDVQKALKQLGIQSLFDHLAQIHWKITGIPPVVVTPTQEEVFKYLFKAIQKPYEKAKAILDPTRKNFLSYSFCLYKFCQMMGYKDLMKCFPLLKGKEKLAKQNQIFNAMIQDLGWKIDAKTGRLLDIDHIPKRFECASGEIQ